MGGKAVPNHPAYLTRNQAAQEIAKALTGDPGNEIADLVYRRIGEYQRSGELHSEPIASGRTRQYHKNDLFSFANKVFDVEVNEFIYNDLQDKQYKKNELLNSTLKQDLISILRLHDRKLLGDQETIDMMKQLVLKNKFEEEEN
jgi:hypothetical protein